MSNDSADDFVAWCEAEAAKPPVITVRRLGRWRWGVHITHGMMAYGPEGGDWTRFGERRAIRKGERELRRYLRRSAWRAQTYELSPLSAPLSPVEPPPRSRGA